MPNSIGSIILEGPITAEDTVISTSGGSNKRVLATGTLQDAEVENRNKRVYGKVDLEREIKGPRIAELLKAGYLRGETGHPLSDDLVRQQTIDPKLVCVKFNKVWMEGNLVKAIFCGTNNEYGETFDRDLREGCLPAFSLRALGSIESEHGRAYVRNLRIITWDHVIYPSHKVAYTTGLVSESASLLDENSFIVNKDDPGRIIAFNEKDAKTVLSRLQRESANVYNSLSAFGEYYNHVCLEGDHKLLLTNEYGDRIGVNLEQHVQNSIMDYLAKDLF